MRRAVVVLAVVAFVPAAAAQSQQGIVTNTRSGAALYAANCASCHGTGGVGVASPGRPGAGNVQGMGPPLIGVGARAADFYLRTGYMPLPKPDVQPSRRRVLFDDQQIRALVRFVASFGGGPPIPKPHPERGDIAAGMQLFTEHCAGCHQIVARGGVVTGARVPPLTHASPVQIAQAVRIGPYVMPAFRKSAISDAQLDSIIRYVDYAKHPSQAGGWGIGFVGPVPEGMVAWFLAAAALVALCAVIGTRHRV